MYKKSNDYLLKTAFWGFFTLLMLSSAAAHLDLINKYGWYTISSLLLAIVGIYFFYRNWKKL